MRAVVALEDKTSEMPQTQRASPSPVVSRLVWPAAAVLLNVSLLYGHPLILQATGVSAEDRAAVIPYAALAATSCFSVAWLSARLVALAVEHANQRRRLPKLFQEAVTAAFFLAALFATFGLAQDGTVIGSLATSGVVIAILGFALRNVIADVVLGMALGLERSYRIGDWLKIDNGVCGVVVEINWRTTRLLTRNQTHVILPNSRIAQRQLINYSAPKRQYRDQLRICLPHSVPAADAKRVLLAAARSAYRNQSGPAPDVRAVAYAPGGIEYAVRYWVPSYAEEADCRDVLLTAIDTGLRHEGLHVLGDVLDVAMPGCPARRAVNARQDESPPLRQDFARPSKEEA
ncbi:mechanosensitive ion channel family protein [Azospirillum sp.]|uniref:mechanosensitive ion channel family protein n=1 Tax=Azospirillum sp. TaxID=34012 RepID=UPI003D7233FA